MKHQYLRPCDPRDVAERCRYRPSIQDLGQTWSAVRGSEKLIQQEMKVEPVPIDVG